MGNAMHKQVVGVQCTLVGMQELHILLNSHLYCIVRHAR